MKLAYPAVFTNLEEQEGYCVEFPDLPGCVTQGNSLIEAVEMAIDASSGWVLDELEDGKPVPKASNINEIVITEGFINLIILDMDAYAEKYGDKAIRKNCTIPAWLNTMAEKQNVNFSKLLQEKLQEVLL